MKLGIFSFCICGVLILALIAAGCTSNEKSNSSSSQFTPTSSPESSDKTLSLCKIPPFLMNDTQEKTKIVNGFSLSENSSAYIIPVGSIIYHTTDGITRVFDSKGVQLLIANDSESQYTTPNGYKPATKILETPSTSVIQNKGNMSYVYLNGSCILTIIDGSQSYP